MCIDMDDGVNNEEKDDVVFGQCFGMIPLLLIILAII